MRIPFLLFVIVSAAFACSTPSDGAKKDAGSSTDAGGTFSACGVPGQVGNEIGVGQYCELITDCSGQTLCSSLVNDPDNEPQRNTFVCVLPCDPCTDPVGFCGSGASCVCQEALGGCGCFPTACSDFASHYGMPKTCHTDAGPTDAGEVTDAGDMTDAGPADAGDTPDAG